MDRTTESNPTPARECVDLRGHAALVDVIARHDRQCMIPSALAMAAQEAAHDGDGDLAHWLNDTVLAIGDRMRLHERLMREPAVHPTFAGILGAWQGAR